MRVLTISLIVMISSGCSFFKNDLVEPLCLPLRPILEDISVEQQRKLKAADEAAFTSVVLNDISLKAHIVVIETIVGVHNEQFTASCDG